ncbi:hypothetical protein ES288_A11G079800v1 [Gossypium darwinii]|uniref:Uncharacterized protein n=1 Tax=Gossypium darwinii TaxID=34276 RepID=A0A5D2EIT3_GOSDA|nr:hypothetical protein ES288_A11G079800v1 [Gossypium darwinii]
MSESFGAWSWISDLVIESPMAEILVCWGERGQECK